MKVETKTRPVVVGATIDLNEGDVFCLQELARKILVETEENGCLTEFFTVAEEVTLIALQNRLRDVAENLRKQNLERD